MQNNVQNSVMCNLYVYNISLTASRLEQIRGQNLVAESVWIMVRTLNVLQLKLKRPIEKRVRFT